MLRPLPFALTRLGYSTSEFAETLRISEEDVRKMHNHGLIKPCKKVPSNRGYWWGAAELVKAYWLIQDEAVTKDAFEKRN